MLQLDNKTFRCLGTNQTQKKYLDGFNRYSTQISMTTRPSPGKLLLGLRAWGFQEVLGQTPAGWRLFTREHRGSYWLHEPDAVLVHGETLLAARQVSDTGYQLLAKCGEIWDKYGLEPMQEQPRLFADTREDLDE